MPRKPATKQEDTITDNMDMWVEPDTNNGDNNVNGLSIDESATNIIPKDKSDLLHITLPDGSSSLLVMKFEKGEQRWTPELIRALAKAQGQFPSIVKDKENPFHKSSYASLDAILAAVVPVLSANGLAMTHQQHIEGGQSILRSYLVHESLGYMESITSLSAIFGANAKNKAQELGSGLSYLKRYTIAAMLNLGLGDDDDGNSTAPDPRDALMQRIKQAREANDLSPQEVVDIAARLYPNEGISKPTDIKDKLTVSQIDKLIREIDKV